MRVKRGIYRKKEVLEARGAVENVQKSSDNVKTINRLLNLYDEVLDNIALTIQTEDWTAVGKRMDVMSN